MLAQAELSNIALGTEVVGGYVGLKVGFAEQYSWKGKGRRTLKDV